jgi:hypothetical protein
MTPIDHLHQSHPAGAHFGRRSALLGTAAALASAALVSPSAALARDRDDDGRPQPAPKPIVATLPGTDFHVMGPGPTSITLPFSRGQLMGLDVDPSVITDFSGFAALAYPVGSVQGSDGKHYNLEGDMRIFSGTYVLAMGARREGAFCLV